MPVPLLALLERPGPWAYVRAAGAVGIATAIGAVAFAAIGLADVAMLYLIAIVVASLAGRGPALFAASLAVAALDFCFVPPRFTFAVDNLRHLLTFAVMFGAGLTIASLHVRVRRQEAAARDAAIQIRTEAMRSSLLAAVSHDLRTPLGVVTGAATSLRDDHGQLDAGARAELLDTIVEEAQRLERVLTNLLAMTRVETGHVPAREWVPVDELVGAALTRLEGALGDRAVVVDVPEDVGVSVDPVLFQQVLINLIDNAIKHGRPPIEVRARRAGRTIELDVADHGLGVPAGAEERVFDKFFRASEAPGVGLGLAVVRGLVEAHGGTITAAGARFRIVLPEAGAPS